LTDAERKADRGAFFKSIHATLDHLTWADEMWLSRFTAYPKPGVSIPGSTGRHPAWDGLRAARQRIDSALIDWADRLDPDWLQGELTWYSGAMQREVTQAKALLVVHLFNHQTHHRGQVHAMLTAAGARPGDTDLPMLVI
jgi:uncharacterized damage-inducible protein DinB